MHLSDIIWYTREENVHTLGFIYDKYYQIYMYDIYKKRCGIQYIYNIYKCCASSLQKICINTVLEHMDFIIHLFFSFLPFPSIANSSYA